MNNNNDNNNNDNNNNDNNNNDTVEMETVTQTDVNEVDNFTSSIDELQNNVDSVLKDLRLISNDIKNHKKKYLKIMKTLNKQKNKRTADSKNTKKKEPSGFVSPIGLTEELSSFMNVENGVELPRTVVTKFIIAYIKEHHLENKQNGRNFDLTDNTDPFALKLKNLFKIEKGDEVNYFNLQSYLKQHFVSLASKTKTETENDDVLPEHCNKKLRLKKPKHA